MINETKKNSFKKIYNHRWCIHSFDGCFSTAAFWFIFSSSEKTTLKDYTNIAANLYNKNSSYELLHDLSSSRIRVTLLDGNGNVLLESDDGVDVTKWEITPIVPNL